MNSEELEQSLRTEFDDYLKKVFDEIREDVSGFQTKIDSAIEEHKRQLEDVFKELTARFDKETELDEGFKSSIVEHLRLAKDEGARITAEAVEEAEKFDEENRIAPEANFSELRDAIADISQQDSQADILKSLVEHASQFTPRGAFFIIKNDHFVGWRVFGKEQQDDDQAIRDVFFPVSESTVLSQAAHSLETEEGSFGSDGDEAAYLDKLGFGQPDRMYAVPLIARGRSVAVLYADYGQEGTNVNVEALETLVQVAGLTVELLAASRGSKVKRNEQPETAYAAAESESETATPDFESEASDEADQNFSYQTSVETDDSPEDDYSYSQTQPVEEETEETELQPVSEESADEDDDFQPISEESDESVWNKPSEIDEDYDETEQTPEYSDGYETESYQPVTSESDYAETSPSDYQFENSGFNNQFQTGSEVDESQIETAKLDSSQFETFTQTENYTDTAVATEDYSDNAQVVTEDYSAPANDFGSFDPASSYSGDSATTETVSEASTTPPVRTRFSDRNVDLPIEVGEDERRLHNDARRFARLLVSEIKLYNEQKVKEGREANDIYDRLREAIDRSREMYDKRVQSPVAAKFDYFHYELVNSLGDGDESVLGNSYPGASV